MTANEIQKSVAGVETTETKMDVLSKVGGFFQKFKSNFAGNSGNKKPEHHKTKAFTLTRKDSVIGVLVALCVLGGTIVYGWFVVDKYHKMNENIGELKNVSTYNVTPNSSILSPYINGQNISTVNGMISVYDNVQNTLEGRKLFKQQQKSYYEVLLQNIYLPSLNIRKDPYTQNFDMTILGQKYLESDKFQDLYLIQYWSDFVKYVGNDADYNIVESINIEDKVELEGSDYFYTPISITFKSPNKRSFLLLVNKLSMTSNSSNIALVNEFFFYLLMNIKEKKSQEIQELMKEYWPEFSSSSNRSGPSELPNLSGEELSNYQDKVIGYNLYKRINSNGTGTNMSPLIDDALIAETVKESTLCDSSISDAECFYNFRDKYRDLPYLAYTVGLEKQTNRVSGLLNFLQNLPSVITITDFGFEKFSNSSFLNNEQEQYEGTVSFNSYGRNITLSELEETGKALGELCFGVNSNQKISPEVALSRINDTIASLGGMDENINVSALGELQGIFSSIVSEYDGLPNYNKMIKLFEIRRMMNDANLCNV